MEYTTYQVAQARRLHLDGAEEEARILLCGPMTLEDATDVRAALQYGYKTRKRTVTEVVQGARAFLAGYRDFADFCHKENVSCSNPEYGQYYFPLFVEAMKRTRTAPSVKPNTLLYSRVKRLSELGYCETAMMLYSKSEYEIIDILFNGKIRVDEYGDRSLENALRLGLLDAHKLYACMGKHFNYFLKGMYDTERPIEYISLVAKHRGNYTQGFIWFAAQVSQSLGHDSYETNLIREQYVAIYNSGPKMFDVLHAVTKRTPVEAILPMSTLPKEILRRYRGAFIFDAETVGWVKHISEQRLLDVFFCPTLTKDQRRRIFTTGKLPRSDTYVNVRWPESY